MEIESVKSSQFNYLACLVLILAGCASDKGSRQDEVESMPSAVVIETLGTGFTGSIRDTTEAVYRSRSAWNKVAATLTPLKEFPEIDSSQVMVVLVAIPTSSGGYSVEFKTAEATDDEIIITYELGVPGYDCITTAALSLTFQAATVPRSNLPVRVVRENAYYSCST